MVSSTIAYPSTVQPLLFGPAEMPLYGCFHASQRGRHCDIPVLICPPIGHESVRSHRCLRILAARLAAAGVSALRFDYFGTGDSAGDAEDVTLDALLVSVQLAADELRSRTGADAVSLVGVRFGAALGAVGAAASAPVNRAVLWQPVGSGADFLAAARAEHARHLAWSSKEFGAPPASVSQELLGYRWSESFLREVAALDLTTLPAAPADEVLLIHNGDAQVPDLGPVRSRLEQLGARVTDERVEEPGVWDAEPAVAVMPQASLARIVEWLALLPAGAADTPGATGEGGRP